MERIIDIRPHLKKDSPVYAVTSIPLYGQRQPPRRRRILRRLGELVDILVSLVLGAVLLVFLVLLIISL